VDHEGLARNVLKQPLSRVNKHATTACSAQNLDQGIWSLIMNAITTLNNGRFIRDHGSSTISYRDQVLAVCGPNVERELIEYDRN
jgi:hypothetical protein